MTAHAPYPPASSGPGSFPANGRSSWNGGSEKRPYGPPSKGYLHMRDIIADSSPDISRNAPLHTQLDRASNCISAAKRSVEFKRPDLAYKEFLKGFEITVNYIPRHEEFAAYTQKNRSWYIRYKDVYRAASGMEPMMEQIRKMIEEDNELSGVLPKNRTSEVPRNHEIFPSVSGSPNSNDLGNLDSSANRQRGPASSVTSNTTSSKTSDLPPSLVAGPARNKPTVRPKPTSLHGNTVKTPSDVLADRFARLRMPSDNRDSPIDSVKIPVPEDFQRSGPTSPTDSRSQSSGSPVHKPSGPREMPASNVPIIPPKVPLTPVSSALPQAPAPTYSPAKSVPPPSVLSASRSSMDAARPSGLKRQYYYNQPTSRPGSPFRPSTPLTGVSMLTPKNDSREIPNEKALSPETLMNYMKRYNVLLIDVRPRADFDEGHILSAFVICIEPVSLKAGVSAEDLEERLVVSPDAEQDLFSRRNQYDIIVYYDDATASTSFLSGPPPDTRTRALRALYDTLVEFNDYKPLKDGRPPALLSGGIEGWIDLIGPHSLAQSKTAGVIGSTKTRTAARASGPSSSRQRLAHQNSTSQVRRQRLASLRPIPSDEAQAWLKKAQEDEIDSREFQEEEESEDQAEAEAAEAHPPQSPFVPDYESFLRRFPSINGEPQSMIRPSQSRIPSYEPEPSSLPPAPSRPPPAIPRPSYSGLADTNASQAPLARQVSATRPALYTSGSILRRNIPLHRTGLENLGNTCFLNATLQCLAATIPFSAFFKTDNYKALCSRSQYSSQGIVPSYFATIMRQLWKEDKTFYSPRQFIDFITKRKKWDFGAQQDAGELLDTILDILHEDFNVHHDRTKLKPLTTAQEEVRERMPVPDVSLIEWERHEHNNRSFIEALFAGQFATRTTCPACGFRSTIYDVFYTITLPIPNERHRDGYDLSDCIRDWLSPEKVDDWKCEKCHSVGGRRQVILTRLPQFLIIHLMRFGYDKNTRDFSKIRSLINYPLYGLNLDEFVYGARQPPPVKNGHERSDVPDMTITPPFNFDCYGIVRHHGNSPHSGHYTTLARDFGRGCWRSFNDTRLFDFDPLRQKYRDEWLTPDAYILFYQRVPSR